MEAMTAIGMLEFNSIALGIEASDQMSKTAQVSPIFYKTICPGKFLAGIYGDVAAVNASIEAGKALHPEAVVDWFVIPNIHPEVVKALAGGGVLEQREALGVIETFSAAAIVEASDAAVKAAAVTLLDVRTALGLGGKGYCLIGGDVAAVEAAVEAGAAKVSDNGLLVSTIVIPSPHKDVFDQIS